MDKTTLIIKRLKDLFGNRTTIYRENVKNGFKEDSFFLPAMHVKSESELGLKHNITYSYQVIYFPREDHINDDIAETENTLIVGFLNLENEAVFNRDFQVSDNALVFSFDLQGFVNE